jgi:hypothetical protein
VSRRNQLADIDPLSRKPQSDDEDKPRMSMEEADVALFGELSRRESTRQTVRPVSIFDIQPDIKQARRAVPLPVRARWSGNPRDIADLFNAWLSIIAEERKAANLPPFDLNEHLWAEVVEARQKDEDAVGTSGQPGPIEKTFLAVITLAVSIRRDGLANPITIQRTGPNTFRLETGERRWLSYQILYGYFNGEGGKPQERDKWGSVPAIIVDDFNVWRQASENTARADLNAVGRARQFSILLMDLLGKQGQVFQLYEALVQGGQADRNYYAQVANKRVPKGKGEMLANALGVAHRAAFTRCRILLGLPDEVWLLGDTLDLPEDELLRIAKIESPEEAVEETRRIAANVATRNISDGSPAKQKSTKKSTKPPTLFADTSLKRGKKLFSRQIEWAAKEIFALRGGVGQAQPATKLQIREKIDELRRSLDTLEQSIDSDES